MSTLPGIIFNVDMNPVDDFIRREYLDLEDINKNNHINSLLTTKRINYYASPNEEHELVKISCALQEAKTKIINRYRRHQGRLPEDYIKKYLDDLQTSQQQILLIYQRYSQTLLQAYQEKFVGIDHFNEKKDALEKLLAQKKQAIADSLNAELSRIAQLPLSIRSGVITQSHPRKYLNFLFSLYTYKHYRIDKDSTIDNLWSEVEVDEALDSLVTLNQNNKSTVLKYNFIDSHAGKYHYNRFDSRQAKLEIEFTKTNDSYNYKIKLLGLNGTPRHFSSDKDLLHAYQVLVAHIARYPDCILDLNNFQERFRAPLLKAWVETHGRALADVIEAEIPDKDIHANRNFAPGTYQVIHEVVKNNITKDELLAYCSLSPDQKLLLDKQIANDGAPLSLSELFPELAALTRKDKLLLQQQILNHGKKLSTKTHSISEQDVKQADKLYQRYKEASALIHNINSLYITHHRLVHCGLADNLSLKNSIKKLIPTKAYAHHCNLAKHYFKQQNLLYPKSDRVQHPENEHLYKRLLPLNPLAFSTKTDTIPNASHKDKYLPQNPIELCEILTNGLLSLNDSLILFTELPLNKQTVILRGLDLGPNQQHAFLLAQLFSCLAYGHHQTIYQQLLTKKQQAAIFPYLTPELQIICAPDQPAQFFNHYLNKIIHSLSSSSAKAGEDYIKLVRLDEAEPLAISTTCNDCLASICNLNNLSHLQIGTALSIMLTDEQFNASAEVRSQFKHTVVTYLLSQPTTTDAAKILTQMTPSAQYQFTLLAAQQIAKEAPLLDSLVALLNHIRSNHTLEHLAASIDKPVLLKQILNHPQFNNKHSFKKFIAGITVANNPGSEKRQLQAFEKINLYDKIAGQFKKSLAFAALSIGNQVSVCERLLKQNILAAQSKSIGHWPKEQLNELQQEFSQKLTSVTTLPSPQSSEAKSHYSLCLEHYQALYRLAEKFKHADYDLNIDELKEEDRLLADIYKRIHAIETKMNDKASSLSEEDYKAAIEELKALEPPFNTIALSINKLSAAEISRPPYAYIEELLDYYCPTMPAITAKQLLEKAQKQQWHGLEGLEEKMFIHFKEPVKQQVFASLSAEAQLAMIKNEQASTLKRAEYLNSVETAATVKNLLKQLQPIDPALLVDLKPALQKELITDKDLISDDLYNQLARYHKQCGHKTLLQDLYQTRPFKETIIADIGLKKPKPKPKAPEQADTPTQSSIEQLISQMKR